MPTVIIQKEEVFNLYSTVTDSPVFVSGMDKATLLGYLDITYGTGSKDINRDRVESSNETGTSMVYCSLKELIDSNRAGPKESTLPYKDFIDRYLTIRDNK